MESLERTTQRYTGGLGDAGLDQTCDGVDRAQLEPSAN